MEVAGVLWRKEDRSAAEKLSVAEQEMLSWMSFTLLPELAQA